MIYCPNTDLVTDFNIFAHTFYDIFDTINTENKYGILIRDLNINLLKFGRHDISDDYHDNLFLHGFVPIINKQTIFGRSSATLMDHICSNLTYLGGIITIQVADRFTIFFPNRNTFYPICNKNRETRFYT